MYVLANDEIHIIRDLRLTSSSQDNSFLFNSKPIRKTPLGSTPDQRDDGSQLRWSTFNYPQRSINQKSHLAEKANVVTLRR